MLIAEFLDLLHGVKRLGAESRDHIAKCPAHDDSDPSLSVGIRDGKILINCYTGCSAKDVVSAMGLTLRDLFEDNGNRGVSDVRPAKRVIRRPEPKRPQEWRDDYEGALWMARSRPERLKPLADYWRVTTDVLARMGCGFLGTERFAMPMMNGNEGELIGVRTIELNGDKRALVGSRNGLFMATDELPPDGQTVYVCEGASDTASLINLGLFAIGRPSCNSGGAMVATVVYHRDTVILSDDDAPGIKGAEALALNLRRICRTVRVMHPLRGKDARAWCAAGATKQEIENHAKTKLPC